MAKKALLDVLEQTIGKYVKNLDAESLNVAVWSGKIELHSLELDVAAVNAELDRQAAETPNLALPLQVLSGHFEALEVDVPWASLTSRSVVLRARGLYVDVQPFDRLAATDHLQASVESEEARSLKIKQARAKSIEMSEKYRRQAYVVRKLASAENNAAASGEGPAEKTSFGSRLVRRIIENIQVEITDVHVCLTDAEGKAGVVLEKLSLVTTDKDGQQVFVDRTAKKDVGKSFLHKALLLRGFGVYLDHEEFKTEKFITAKTSLGGIQEHSAVRGGPPTKQGAPPPMPAPAPILDHSYVLAPLSFQAQLRQGDGQVCVDYAKYQLSSELSSLSVLLSRQQLELARRISNAVSSSNGTVARPLFPEYRPLTRITSGDAARQWWRYSVRCIGRLNGRRSWMEFLYAYQKRKEYIPLYKRQAHSATCSWLKPLTVEERGKLIHIEQDRTISVDGLMAWRNIADGQADMEEEKKQASLRDKKKNEKSSYFSSIFGSTATATIDDDQLEEDPPIHLSVDELKELESMNKEQFEDEELSVDSKLYDANFVLNSLKINLTNHDMLHLAVLEMGAVTVDFKAAADGAFSFDFDLANLEIQDRVTRNSLFPSVLKSIESQKDMSAFNLHVSKARNGDQKLKAQLAAFEAIASHLLFKELNRFVAASAKGPSSRGKRENPILAQSMSGSVDLFYDADQGASAQMKQSKGPADREYDVIYPVGVTVVENTQQRSATSDISNVLVDAWKEKMAKRAAWVVDIDIKAPVVLIPQKCNDPRASVLVFDLGRFKLTYGRIDPATKVAAWFDENPRIIEEGSELTHDSGNISVRDLTFKVARASDWRLMLGENVESNLETSVVDPISVSLDIGVESLIQSIDPPRICCIGVIPIVGMRMSPTQGSTIISVLGSWIDLLAKIEEESPNVGRLEAIWEDKEDQGINSFVINDDDNKSTSADSTRSDLVASEQVQLFVMIGLQRLSVTVSLDSNSRLEAHLVSVYASMQVKADGSAAVGLRMGWFWILDMLKSSHSRHQRLLAHSTLPRSSESFAQSGRYDIMEKLTEQGVFDSDYAGSSELADIFYQKISYRSIKEAKQRGEFYIESTVHASFSSLFLHWNPHSVKGVSNLMERLSSLAEDFEDSSTLISSPEKVPRTPQEAPSVDREVTRQVLGQMRVSAQMHRLDFNLNSARDDLPLFVLTVSETRVSVLSGDGAIDASITLGDIRVRSPENMGRTLSMYRTLLGLAPGRSDNLLTVQYVQGRRLISGIELPAGTDTNLEAFAQVDLSPMRMCFIQSQVMALVEYFSEGILGALTAKAATSAAQKASQLAESGTGKKLFRVIASDFDLVLPQAAYSEKSIEVHAGTLVVEYSMLPGTGGSEAKVDLGDVVMRGDSGDVMQVKPIRMSVNVVLPSDEVGTLEDQAMRVTVSMTDASFLLSRSRYLQILDMLDENMGQLDLFLRNNSIPANNQRSRFSQKDSQQQDTDANELTHAGNKFIDKQRRMNLAVALESMSLYLTDSSHKPMIRIAATDARITYDSFPDKLSKTSDVTLHSLVCEDMREEAAQRQYRYLIRQEQSISGDEDDLFFIGYSSGTNQMSLELKVGSPQIVMIPDTISEIIAFVKSKNIDDSKAGSDAENEIFTSSQPPPSERLVIHSTSGLGAEVEATLMPSGEMSRSHIAATTNICQIILVDLGSQVTKNPGKQHQLTETLILQGQFAATMTSMAEKASGSLIESNFSGQADAMEIFCAFGQDMRSPLQILEPVGGSLHGSIKSTVEGTREVEIRAAALTPFDFTISMHNAALCSAIFNSLKASFESVEGGEEDETVNLNGISKDEQEHIESLAVALEKGSEPTAVEYHTGSSSLGEISTAASSKTSFENTGPRLQLKVTMPETKVTVINDLQGLDEALFRASVTNLVAGADVNRYGSPDMAFEFHMNTSILADYFDTSCNIWNNLLVKPWEITLKGSRSESRRFKSKRLSTTIDLESFPCCVSFSEQFLVSLASASRMWSIYSVATAIHMDGRGRFESSGSMKASMAASAVRNLITSMPYAIENTSGIDIVFSLAGKKMKHSSTTGSIKYFRFEPPKGAGFGGKRRYGQDLNFDKAITIFLEGDSDIIIDGLDFGQEHQKTSHRLKDGKLLMTCVSKEGKTTVVRLTSSIDIINNTALPFQVSLADGVEERALGTCMKFNRTRGNDTPLKISENGVASKDSISFSVPIDALSAFQESWDKTKAGTANFTISPSLPDDDTVLRGRLAVQISQSHLQKSGDGRVISKFDVVCSPETGETKRVSPLVIQVVLSTWLTLDGMPQIEIRLEPRALVENKFPIPIKLRTPMPHTFSSAHCEEILGKDVVYSLHTGDRVQIFTPGPSIAITITTDESPIAGSDLGWLDGGWLDLPLVSEFSLIEPLRCLLPFSKDVVDVLDVSGAAGCEFFIVEGAQSLSQLSAAEEGAIKSSKAPAQQAMKSLSPDAPLRTFYTTVCHFGVDHTGDILFEQVQRSDPIFKMTMDDSIAEHTSSTMRTSRRHSRRSSAAIKMTPFSAFASEQLNRRITLLPSGNVPLRILQMTMEDDLGFRRSLPFFVEELPIGDGGIDTIPILWESKKASGYYAYRTILNEHQSEAHIIPEFQIFNGSRNIVLVKERERPEVIVEGGNVSSLAIGTRERGLEIALHFIELDCRTSFFRMDKLGLKVMILKSSSGVAVGSVCIQTVIDTHGASRLVVKIGEIDTGAIDMDGTEAGLFRNDFFRFRVRWTELQLILNELHKPDPNRNLRRALSAWSPTPLSRDKSNLDTHERPTTIQSSPAGVEVATPSRFNFTSRGSSSGELNTRSKIAEILQQPVASILFSRFTFDFQRVFKDHQEHSAATGLAQSPERSQISLIVHNVIVKDLTPDSSFPMVFDCSSANSSFLDLCVRVRGPLDAEIVKVDLFDLNLAHANGMSERIKLTTSEEYVWRLIDLANRILSASGDFAGYSLKLEEDNEHGGFIVKMEDSKKSDFVTNQAEYSPPKSDTLYDINVARVSPFSLLVSFKRNPQASRYKKVGSTVHGSAMMNYFSQKLKFTIDRAELNFSRYEDRSLKGPPDRLLESLSAVYISRMKFKLVTLLTAASLQDWKYLAARGQGDDEYVEGDILRATGNLTGKASHMIFKKAGERIGDGVSEITRAFGNTIERTTDKIGAGRVGAGVNSVVTGVGDGFGSTISGVGSGTGKILKGAGQGVGHAIGGVAGGALQIGKGIGKGITKGDGRAVIDGFQQGLSSAGSGLVSGAESAVYGTADGIFSAGRGLFTGVANVGKGIGGAFTGKKHERKSPR